MNGIQFHSQPISRFTDADEHTRTGSWGREQCLVGSCVVTAGKELYSFSLHKGKKRIFKTFEHCSNNTMRRRGLKAARSCCSLQCLIPESLGVASSPSDSSLCAGQGRVLLLSYPTLHSKRRTHGCVT